MNLKSTKTKTKPINKKQNQRNDNLGKMKTNAVKEKNGDFNKININ